MASSSQNTPLAPRAAGGQLAGSRALLRLVVHAREGEVEAQVIGHVCRCLLLGVESGAALPSCILPRAPLSIAGADRQRSRVFNPSFQWPLVTPLLCPNTSIHKLQLCLLHLDVSLPPSPRVVVVRCQSAQKLLEYLTGLRSQLDPNSPNPQNSASDPSSSSR
jgi:hypothetical protein